MSQYKELANRLEETMHDDAGFHLAVDEAIAILRSLDAQRPKVDEVMAQAQVFASAWALIGSRFVSGTGLEEAEQEKKDLRTAIEALAAPVAAQPTREQIQRERMEALKWNAKAFDFAGYFAALQRAMHARNATPADVSRATGVSATTLTRMKEGRRPDAASLAALSAWAGLNPAAYVKASPATADFDLPAQSDEVAAQPQQAKPLSDAWAEGYKAGIEDERISESNIGIAGYSAKVTPARQNPYCIKEHG